MAKHSDELKNTAKQLYIKGWSIPEISKETGVIERTLYNWRDAGGWLLFSPPDTVEQAVARRINILVDIDNKTPAQLDELSRLMASFGDLRINIAKADKLHAEAKLLASGGYIPQEFSGVANTDVPGDPSTKKGKVRSRKKTVKNDISELTEEKFEAFRNGHFFDYQLLWHEKSRDPETKRTRFILKSRQIGATYYFAYEAFEDAVLNGENQLFLSSSRDQAEVFKAYIISIAQEHFGIELKGQGVIKLSNGAEIRFLSTNSKTANSYHGHLYCDEIYYMTDFVKLWDIASGMASHKHWRRTLFSVPSAKSHPAYKMWNGDNYNSSRAKDKKVEFDVSHKALCGGVLGVDGVWRQIVTVEDAEKQGCDLFDIQQLKDENTWEAFKNKYLCEFIDDAESIFKLKKLLQCMVDTDTWGDYFPDAARPFGNRPVSLGYDPSRTKDNASLAILAIPLNVLEKWRVLRTISYHGQNFQYQANRIKEICDTHNVKHIGIDVTGIGRGVFELVEQFFRRATPITYSVQSKTELVIKAIDVIENDRLEYPASNRDITQSLMMITQTTTTSGVITYSASRSNTAGHADVAWSIMHALNYEAIAPRKKTTVSFSN